MMSSGPISVLHVMRPAAGGMRRHLLDLARHTDSSAITCSVAGPSDFLQSLPDDAPFTARHDLAIAHKTSLLADASAAGRLAKLINPGISLVHAHGLRAAWVADFACRIQPFPLVVTAHNIVPSGLAGRAAIRVIAQVTRRFVAVSEAVAESLVRCGAARERIVVIPNGVDLAYFQNLPSHARTEFDLDDDDFTVGCIARLSPEKGVDVLISAARQLPEVRFLIAGDGPARADLSRDLPANVRLLGQLSDVRPVLAASNLLAIPSRSEGQGIVALEAMACGVPVVASRVGGLPDMVQDGLTGLSVPPDDPTALADAIRGLQMDRPQLRKLAEIGRMIVSEQYDVRQSVAKVGEVYRELSPRR